MIKVYALVLWFSSIAIPPHDSRIVDFPTKEACEAQAKIANAVRRDDAHEFYAFFCVPQIKKIH